MASTIALHIQLPLALPGQRIGIMGGSFNPPHEGHLIVARTALRRAELDQLWWVVTPGNPLKSHNGLAPLDQRIAACRQLIGADPRMSVTGFETQLGSAYTAATLRFLVRRLPAVRFAWVMGADNLAQFHRWQEWRGIARLMPLVVVDRPKWRLKALAGPAAQAMRSTQIPERDAATLLDREPPTWTYLTSKLSALSSTDLRAAKR